MGTSSSGLFKSGGAVDCREPSLDLGNKAVPPRQPGFQSWLASLSNVQKTAAPARTPPPSKPGPACPGEAKTDQDAVGEKAEASRGRQHCPGLRTLTHQLGGPVRPGTHDAVLHGPHGAAAAAATALFSGNRQLRSLNREPARSGR